MKIPKFKNTVSQVRLMAKSVVDVFRAYCKKHHQLPISLTIVFVGLFLAILLVITKKPPQKVEIPSLAPLVETQKVSGRDIQMVITGYGTVTPKVEVEIVPQVSGRVVWVNPNFRPGGFLEAGANLFRIEAKDFELQLQQARAVVAEAEVKLDLEKAEAAVAIQEWQQLHPGTRPDSALVLRTPQIRQAQAQLESARASLAKAKIDLDRTNVTLPIKVCISSKSVDLGQFVTAGKLLGRAYGTETMEVELQIKDEDLKWFDVSSDSSKTTAEVMADFAGERRKWNGHVKRTTGQVDRNSRMVAVVVEIGDAFHAEDQNQRLMPGTFVEVNINGRLLKGAIAVMRQTVHNGDEVWVVSNGVLSIQQLSIVRADEDFVYVTSGLKDGDEIVVSSLDNVVDKMSVRFLE